MSNTLESILDMRCPPGDVGIELEVEGKKLNEGRVSSQYAYDWEVRPTFFSSWPHVPGWITKEDGSLNNGMEYITRSPVKVDDKTKTKINKLVTALGDNVTNNSIRTSCHVHVNALPLSPLEVVNAMVSFYLVEELLSDYWGEERKGNNYCCRLQDNPLQMASIIDDLDSKRLFGLGRNTGLTSPRYMSLNLQSLKKHGSLEFRGMRGTVDTDIIWDWVCTAQHIVHKASKKYKTPLHLFENFMNTSNQTDFLKKIIGPHLADKMDYSSAKIDKVMDNAITIADLAYMHEPHSSWTEWEQEIIKERSKRTSQTNATASSTTTASGPAQADSWPSGSLIDSIIGRCGIRPLPTIRPLSDDDSDF